jgi:chitinase
MQRRLPNPFLLLSLLAATLAPPGFAQNLTPKPLIVGYFGQWGLYNDPQYTLKDLAANNKAAMLDQLNYAQGFVTGGHCSVADPNADLNHIFAAADSVNGQPDDPTAPFRGHFHQLAELKHAYPRLKVVISLEGRASDFAFDAQPENRQAFIASCIDLFVKGNLAPNVSVPGLFDGIDVDWEYPQGPDAANFLALLTELRQQMNLVRPGLKLTIAVGPSPRMYQGTDFTAVSAQVDEVGLMTYDLAGPWMRTTGFIAPLYSVPRPSEPQGQLNDAALIRTPAPTGVNPTASTTPAANAAMPAGSLPESTPAPRPPPAGGAAGSARAFLAAGVPPAKLLLGVPFYGYGWTQVPEVGNGVFQEGNPVRGDRPYRYIQSLFANSTVYRDPVSQTPWLFDGDAFWTFDDPISIRAKAAYVLDHNLGGLMIWELSDDTPQAALLTAAHQTFTQRPPTTSAD